MNTNELMAKLQAKYQHEKEYLQAVHEVLESIEEVYNNVTSGLKPGRTNVVLMHDSNNKEYTIGALAAIIDFALNEGYEFKAITSDTPQVTHKVAN